MNYLYCLTSTGGSRQSFPPGINGAKVYLVSFGSLTALVSDVGPESLAGTAEEAAAHGEIVNRAWQAGGGVIPFRFGTVFAKNSDVLSLLKKHRISFEACLNRLAGKIEVGIKAIFGNGSMVAAPLNITRCSRRGLSQGERYLLKKRERYRAGRQQLEKAEQFSRALKEGTASLWEEIKIEKQRSDKGLVVTFCYLLDRGELSCFKVAYQRLRKEWPGLKLLYSGPWPPYTFAQVELLRCGY